MSEWILVALASRLIISPFIPPRNAELKTLNVRANDLRALPPSLGHLPRLEHFMVEQNMLRRLPYSLQTGPASDLKKHLRKMGPPAEEPLGWGSAEGVAVQAYSSKHSSSASSGSSKEDALTQELLHRFFSVAEGRKIRLADLGGGRGAESGDKAAAFAEDYCDDISGRHVNVASEEAAVALAAAVERVVIAARAAAEDEAWRELGRANASSAVAFEVVDASGLYTAKSSTAASMMSSRSRTAEHKQRLSPASAFIRYAVAPFADSLLELDFSRNPAAKPFSLLPMLPLLRRLVVAACGQSYP